MFTTMAYRGTVLSRDLVKTEEGFPTKLYTFVMAIDNGIFPDLKSVKQHLLELINENPEIAVHPHRYAIGIAWGYKEVDKPVKAMDIFSYKFDKPWDRCNPDVHGWVFKNHNHTPYDREVTCETGTIILGKEAELRRLTKSLENYINSWPDIGDLLSIIPKRQLP